MNRASRLVFVLAAPVLAFVWGCSSQISGTAANSKLPASSKPTPVPTSAMIQQSKDFEPGTAFSLVGEGDLAGLSVSLGADALAVPTTVTVGYDRTAKTLTLDATGRPSLLHEAIVEIPLAMQPADSVSDSQLSVSLETPSGSLLLNVLGNLTFERLAGGVFRVHVPAWGTISVTVADGPATGVVAGTVATPGFSLEAGAYTGTKSVSITTSTPGATIYYTVDDSEPTTSSAAYSSPLSLNDNTTVKAKAALTGWATSTVASITYTFTGTVANPSIVPAGSYTTSQPVNITTTTPHATIYYTVDGTTPTTSSPVFATTINVSPTTTVKAFAKKANWSNSAIVSATGLVHGEITHFAGAIGPITHPMSIMPYTATFDSSGNFYFNDGSIIRKITPGGTMSVFAGGGQSTTDDRGDGGPATAATLGGISAIATDTAGNVYIAEFNLAVVRKVNSSGIISIFAGIAPGGGNIYNGYDGDGGLATAAHLGMPLGLAVDATGNVYISDSDSYKYGNHVIRKVDTSGIITTFAGNGSACPDYSTIGDGGPATSACLTTPMGLTFDPAGNLYIGDRYQYVVRKVNTSGNISTVAGMVGSDGYSGDGVPATATQIGMPYALAFYSGSLFIADPQTGGGLILKVGSDGILTKIAGGGTGTDGGPANAAQLISAQGVAVDGSGNVFIVDQGGYIRKVDTSGIISTFVGLYNAGYSGDGGNASAAMINQPWGVALDALGNLYFADTTNNVVRKVATDGKISTIAGTGVAGYSGDNDLATAATLQFPTGVAIDRQGNLYIADEYNSVVRMVDTAGMISTYAGNGVYGSSGDGAAATAASLKAPVGVAVDAAGNLYIADMWGYAIRKVDTSGMISTFAGTGSAGYSGDGGPATVAKISKPFGVAVDQSGNVYIADRANNRVIRKVDTTGTISTFAGTGLFGNSGDGGAATAATISAPVSVAVDTSGNVYIANCSTIRKVDTSNVISTFAGTGLISSSGEYGPATAATIGCIQGIAVDALGNVYAADYQNSYIYKIEK